MSEPVYKQQPALFAFNTVTKKHMLKSGRAYKKAFAANPGHFVETKEPVQQEPRDPIPADDQTVAKQRELIQQLIRQEIKQNSKPYEGKSSAELDLLFRQLLVAKLLKSDEAPLALLTNLRSRQRL